MSSRHRAAAIAVAVTVLTVAACGGNNNPSSHPGSPTSPPTVTPSPTPSPEAAFDPARALDHVRVLSEDIGARAAGTDAEKRAAQYLADELRSYGYDTSLQGFTFDSYADEGSVIELLSPTGQTIAGRAVGGSVNGVEEGDLVNAGRGRQVEFPEGTAGGIALVQRGDLSLAEKVANAAAAGAVAVVLYNNMPGSFTGQLGESSDIPAIGISLEEGQSLLEIMSAGSARVRVTVRIRKEPAHSQNIIAEPPGQRCEIIAGGHYDSVPDGPGANDNASGTAVAVELARVLAGNGGSEPVCFALFGSEEVGLIGSRHHVSTLSDSDRRRIRAMLNFDMLGVGDGWPLDGSESMVSLARQAAEAVGIDARPSELPRGVGSDHAPFIDAGIPALLFNCFCDDNYHTADDRLESVQAGRLREAGVIGLAMIEELLAD